MSRNRCLVWLAVCGKLLVKICGNNQSGVIFLSSRAVQEASDYHPMRVSPEKSDGKQDSH